MFDDLHFSKSPARREIEAEAQISALFGAAGWQNELGVISKGPWRYRLEARALAHASESQLIDAWSRACLMARAASQPDVRPLAVVLAPKVADHWAVRLVDFAERYAPDVALGLMDQEGRRVFRGAGLEDLNAEPVRPSGSKVGASLVARNLFSALNQWLLKLLLAPEIPEGLLNAPRADFRNASALAGAARCGVMSAHRFVEELRAQRFLDESARHLRLVRRAELFASWSKARSQSFPDLPMRFVLHREIRDELPQLFPDGRACLGLFAAADELGMGFVSGLPPYVLLDHPSVLPGGINALPAAQLMVPAGPGEPVHFIARIPRASRSVFNGMVRPRGVASADIIQVWLDVASHPSRGAEQADVIWRRVLAPLVG